MGLTSHRNVLAALLLAISFKTVLGINCYRCSGTDPDNPFVCNEYLGANEDELELSSCDDIYGANYCVKHTGRFEVNCIKCYQCDSTKSLDCSDILINEDGNTLQPEECVNEFEAEYCIKSTGLRGGIGTRRFCSRLDLGNYCDYVQNKGDQLEYRSCIFTCGTDGCNSSSSLSPLKTILFYSTLLMTITTTILSKLI